MSGKFFGADVGGLIDSIGGAFAALMPAELGGSTFRPASNPGGGNFAPSNAAGGGGFAPSANVAGQGNVWGSIAMGDNSPAFLPGNLGGGTFSPVDVGGGSFMPAGMSGGYGFQPMPINSPAPTQTGNGNTGVPGVGGPGGGTIGATDDPVWAKIDQYSALIDKYGAEAGIDPDVFRAIMYNESGGNPAAREPNLGASGLLQLMPSVWQGRGDPLDPETNLRLGAELMRQKVSGVRASYAKNGIQADERTFARDLALAWAGHFDYGTGRPNGTSRDAVFGQTAAQLIDVFLGHYDDLKGRRAKQAPTTPATGSGVIPGGNPLAVMLGGAAQSIMQGYGPTTYAKNNPGVYTYANSFGLPGVNHPGIDFGLAYGTRLNVPVGGTVILAGGSGFFRNDPRGDAPGMGELRIRLDNGDEIILGHMSQIALRPGQRVNAGDFAGLSGGSDGDHLHLEVRRGGKQLVNPYEYFGLGNQFWGHDPNDH